MRISMVSEHASPLALLGGDDAGGQNVHVAELAAALGRRGNKVVVHTRRDDPALPERIPFAPNVWVHHVDAGPAAPIPKDQLLPHMDAFGAELARCWQISLPDIVHSHFWMSGLAALEAIADSGLDLPLLHTYHALGAEKRRQQGAADTSPAERMSVEARLAREATLIVATTAAEARTVVEMGADPTQVQVIPCGVDVRRFQPAGAVRAPGRRIVTASRLVPRKGLAELIEAVSMVPSSELVIAGGPPAGLISEDSEGRRLQALATELGIADRVEFLGAVPRDQMPGLLRSADVVACCPWYEPFGLVAVEAMACGCPVVATEVGGLAETVVDGVTGRLVPPRDPVAIAAAIRDVLDDPIGRARMRRAAAVRARGYSWGDVAAQTLHAAALCVGDRHRERELG